MDSTPFNTGGSDSTAQNLNRHPALAQPAWSQVEAEGTTLTTRSEP
jgi:hypothetical protein